LTKRIASTVMVFIAGGVAACNLAFLKYGIPEHFDGGWGQFGFACLLGCAFGVAAVTRKA